MSSPFTLWDVEREGVILFRRDSRRSAPRQAGKTIPPNLPLTPDKAPTVIYCEPGTQKGQTKRNLPNQVDNKEVQLQIILLKQTVET